MRRRNGFTLVELLVVIGVIALLISILLPALQRAKEAANKVACLSNLRQLGLAMAAYNADNKGWFPHAGVGKLFEDWVYWEYALDPDQGQSKGRDASDGRLVKYMGKKFNPKHYSCPSDNTVAARPAGTYQFSYTINYLITGYYSRDASGNLTINKQPHKITQIFHPSQKMLMVDESSLTIDDACWAPNNYAIDGHNLISNRHDKSAERSTDPNYGRGNVLFADLHADFVDRKLNVDPMNWDPDVQ